MSLEAVRWALAVPAAHRRQPDRPTAEVLRTLAYLATRESDGFTWVSASRIAKDRGVSPATAYRHLDQLAARGLIEPVTPEAMAGTPAGRRYATRARRKPRIWQLALDSFSLSANEDLSPSEKDDLSLRATSSPALSATTREETENSQEEGSRAMTSEAQRDLGGFGDPPPKPFPKQCRDHQRGINYERCGKCATEREAFEAAETAKAEAAARRKAETIRRNRECDDCDESGLYETPVGFKRCTHPRLPALEAVAS